jgi:LPPG:FO 2-phospho-L-lactate transferase
VSNPGPVLALTGGVGGAKLALGLARVLPPQELILVANTGDDFEHLGLTICPDIDTVTYTLSGLANPDFGWGRRDETWSFMQTLADIGGETWFRLGDRDLALHVERTRRLAAGEPLSAITAGIARRLGVLPRLLPMTDSRVRTKVQTDAGWIDFQDYFVRQQCRPIVRALRFEGVEDAIPNPGLLAALANPDLRAVVICPSNPFISVEPILALPGVRAALAACAAPVIAVSPIIGGRAVKGPTAKMFAELGTEPSARAVAARYAGLIDGYVLDHEDAAEAAAIDASVKLARTLMVSLEDRENLARTVLALADTMRP